MIEEIPPNLASSGAIEIADKLKLISGGKILDVATGDGGSILGLINFLKDYDSVIGIDNDENEIEKAQSRLKDKPITIKMMKAEKLEYPDNTFELVNIAYSLHHMQNLNETLSEMKRVLKKSGYFIIQEMFSDGNQKDAQKCHRAVHEFGAEIDRILGIYHREVYTRDEILKILSQIELKDLEIFESSRTFRCLKCEEKLSCEDPKNLDRINSTLEGIDETLEQIKEHQEYTELREKAEAIKQNVKKHGIAGGSILFCIGKKEN